MKKLKFLKHRKIVALALAAVLTITSASGYTGKGGTESKAASINLDDGLLVHYTFNDTLVNSASASGSAATMHAGSEKYTEGLEGKAFDFSENAGTDAIANAKSVIKMADLPKTTAFSVNYWVKGSDALQEVAFHGNCNYFQFGILSGKQNARCSLSKTDTWENCTLDREATTEDTVDTSEWRMVTYTVSDTGKYNVYINGKKVNTTVNYIGGSSEQVGTLEDGFFAYLDDSAKYVNVFSDSFWEGTDAGYIGSGLWWGSNFSGQMDEFRMYERALNDDEIKALAATGIGVTPATGIQKEEDVYKITSDKLSDGSVDLKNVFSSIQTVNIDGDKLNELKFEDVTFEGTGVSGTTVSGLNDEQVHEVTCKYSGYQLTLKLQAITKVACTKLEVKQGDKDVTSLELPKKGVDVVVTATGSESAATTEEISATATGCTATKKGEETKAGNKTSVTYTIEPTADAGSVTFTCGEKTVTVTTSRTAKTFTTKGVIDLDFESSDTAGDEKYTEDGITYTLTNNTEVVANPDDVTDSVLKTTATGYLDSVESILNGIDFSNGVTFTTKIRPEKQGAVWDYVFSLGTSSNAYNYVDGTMGFYMRAGDPYFAYCFFDSTATWAEGNTVGSSDTYFMQEANCNKWYTLTYTYDESAFCVYLDGVPIVRTNASAKADIITSILSKLGDDCKFSLGCGISRTFEKTPAYYDDTKVFNTALSADEVAYLAALGKAEDLTSDVYEDNAAKDAIKSAVTTAKATIKDDETVATDTLQTQTAALKTAITNNESSLKIKTYKITATEADGTFTYDTEANFAAVPFSSDVVFKVNPSAGYSVEVKIDGEAAKPNLAGEYKILNVREAHTVEVTTSAIKYPLITYVDGAKTENTFKITDAVDGNVTLPELDGKNGWFTSATEKDPLNAIPNFVAANYLTDEGITVYAYTKYKITLPANTSPIDGGTVNTLPDDGKDYYLGDTVQIVTTPDSGKTPSAEIEDASANPIDTWVTESDGKQILNFTMPASNVKVKSISFVGVSNAKLTELLNAEKALYDSANATTTEGLTTEYTVDSWNAYTSAYDAAKEVADAGTESKTQAQIDAAANALKEAKAALVHTCAVSMASTLKMEKEEQRDAIEVTVITNGEDKSVTWSSSNEAIVKVNAKTGALAAYDSGTAEITATAADGSTATCTVSVAVSPTAIKLKNCEVLVGATRAMKVTVTPEDASLNGMKWSSSNTSVATVDENGVVKGLKTGETTITATVNGLEESCTLTVINHLDNTSGYHIQLSPGIELGKDPVYMTFKSKTNATGTENWSTPRIGIYTGDTPVTDQTYCLRSDLWADAPNNSYPALTVENLSTVAVDWSSFLAKCREGVDCYVSAVRVSNGVKIRMFVGDVSEQAVIPVEGEGPFYLTLTGGLCDITDIKVVPREEYREPSPYVPVYPVYPGSEVTPKPAITPGPVIDVPIAVDDIKPDETLTGTGWWTGTSTGQNYALSGTDTSMVLYVGASKLDVGGYGAFNIELVSDGNKYLTTGSDKNAWFAEEANGDNLNVPNTGSVLEAGHVYRITITRKGNDITVNYYDATAQKEYFEVTAKNTNFGDNVNVHVMAQVGTFKIGQEVEAEPGDEPTSGPEETSAPDVTTAPTAAPSSEPTAEPSKEPDVTTAPTKEPEATQPAPTKAPESTDDKKVTTGTKVTVSGTTYKVAGSSKVTYTAKKKATATVTVPATVKVNGKTYKVTSIAANAFTGNKKMKKVTVGKNIDTIGKNAFKNCKKLKTIVIKSTKLKASKIGKNAFSGIAKNAVVKVPKSKVKAYTKLLRKKGLSKKVKVKAI